MSLKWLEDSNDSINLKIRERMGTSYSHFNERGILTSSIAAGEVYKVAFIELNQQIEGQFEKLSKLKLLKKKEVKLSSKIMNELINNINEEVIRDISVKTNTEPNSILVTNFIREAKNKVAYSVEQLSREIK